MATATPTKPKPAAKSAPLKANTGKASTAVALKKPTGNIVSIQEALKAQVAALGDRIAPPTGNKIRITQDKKFVLPDGTKTEGPLELVIVDFVAVNNFYEGAFNKDDIVPPGCFSVSFDPKKMVPSANVPNKQADNCQTCPMGQWGSDGDGKACKGGRLLAVLPPEQKDDADAPPIWLLQVSATAIKNFDAYVQGVARTFQSMPVSVVTTVSFDDSVTYAKLMFSVEDAKPNALLGEHFARQAEAREALTAVRDVSGYVPVGKGPAKKAGARR